MSAALYVPCGYCGGHRKQYPAEHPHCSKYQCTRSARYKEPLRHGPEPMGQQGQGAAFRVTDLEATARRAIQATDTPGGVLPGWTRLGDGWQRSSGGVLLTVEPDAPGWRAWAGKRRLSWCDSLPAAMVRAEREVRRAG